MGQFPRVCACVLAAGASRRMGRPKLLAPFAGSTLLDRAIDAAQESMCDQVAVVTGACHAAMRETLSRRGVACVHNPDWESGQASSVRAAAAYARQHGFDALLVMVADQPLVTFREIDALWRAYVAEGHAACVCSTAGHAGNPCLFDAACYEGLSALQGDEGARALFRARPDLSPHRVLFEDPDLLDDADTPGELARLEGLALRRAASPQASRTPLDRSQYPLLERRVGKGGDRPLAYLDSAATALVSERVLAAVGDFLRTSCANIHRGAHLLAEEATDAYECAREAVAAFLGVGEAERLVFTHGATESLNLVAQGWAAHVLAAGDVVAVAEDNHHANIVGWQMAAERAGFEIAWMPLDAQGLLDEAAWRAVLRRRPAAVALSAQSNVLGYRQPQLDALVAEAREAGCWVALDAAQAVSHAPVAFDASGADFCAVSGHKMGALTGVGALACSPRALQALEPLMGGGGMVEWVGREGFRAAAAPHAFEAGTPPIAAAVSWAEAVRQVEEAGLAVVGRHVGELAAFAHRSLERIPGVRVLGASGVERASLVSFVVDGVHPHDVAAELDARGVAVRAGHHCARPLHAALGVPASVRASFAGYTAWEEVHALVKGVAEIAEEGARALA